MNLRVNNIYMYAGLLVVVVITSSIIYKLISKSKTIEGLNNMSDESDKTHTTIQKIVEKLKTKNEMLEDMMLIDKHRTDYEDMFLELEDYCNLSLLEMLSMFSNNPSLDSKTSKTMIEGINEVNTLKNTLNDVMEFMDRKSKRRTTSTNDASQITSYFSN